MAKKLVAVLDIGSDNITAYAGEKTETGVFSIRESETVLYSGYREGLFIDESSLDAAVAECISKLQAATGAKIVRVYAGVPAEFSVIRTRELSKEFSSPVKLDHGIITDIMDKGDIFDGDSGLETITQSALFCTIDDEKLITNPIGHIASSVKIMCSYCLAEREFMFIVSGILKKIGIGDVTFISTPYAESMGLFTKEEREKTVLLADIGYRSTSVMLVRGDGILDLASFSLGKENFLYDLAECFGIDMPGADKLLRQLNLNIPQREGDVFYLTRELGYYATDVAEIVAGRIEDFAVMIKRCLDKFEYQCPLHMALHITGDGILSVKGGKFTLEKYLGRKVEGLAPLVPNYDTPEYSSGMGLIDEALRNERTSTGFFKKLFAR